MEKLINSYTVNLDDETAATLEALARELQRKPRELLRLIISPIIKKEWRELNAAKFPENQQTPTPAHFAPSMFDQFPKM